MILQFGDHAAIANLVGSEHPPELSRAADQSLIDASLIISARVETRPEVLQLCIEEALGSVKRTHSVEATKQSMYAFAPTPPVPTHRISSWKATIRNLAG